MTDSSKRSSENFRPLRIAVLISGTGSNLKTLIDACACGSIAGEIVQVISNRREAGGLGYAREAAIPIELITEKAAGIRDQAIFAALHRARPDLVVLAGFMAILTPELVARFSGSMINLHPSLLPLYPGLDTYNRVIAAGDKFHGASIHFVTAELDAGPVISQVVIPVLSDDTATTLARRLGPREHDLLKATVELFARQRVEMNVDGVNLDDRPLQKPLKLGDNNCFENSL